MQDARRDRDLEAMRTRLATEVAWRFGTERARALAGEIEALAADLARVAATAIPEDTEPGFFLLGRGGR